MRSPWEIKFVAPTLRCLCPWPTGPRRRIQGCLAVLAAKLVKARQRPAALHAGCQSRLTIPSVKQNFATWRNYIQHRLGRASGSALNTFLFHVRPGQESVAPVETHTCSSTCSVHGRTTSVPEVCAPSLPPIASTGATSWRPGPYFAGNPTLTGRLSGAQEPLR